MIRNTYQTIFGEIEKITVIQDALEGYGQGSFIVINAEKGHDHRTAHG